MSSAADPILGLLQEQLECCRNLDVETERALGLLQSGETDAALNLLGERQPATLQIQALENRIKELHAAENGTAVPRLPRRYRAVAESIRDCVQRQLELEDQITDTLGRLATDSDRALGELQDGRRLVGEYVEGLAEGSGVDLVVT